MPALTRGEVPAAATPCSCRLQPGSTTNSPSRSSEMVRSPTTEEASSASRVQNGRSATGAPGMVLLKRGTATLLLAAPRSQLTGVMAVPDDGAAWVGSLLVQ